MMKRGLESPNRCRQIHEHAYDAQMTYTAFTIIILALSGIKVEDVYIPILEDEMMGARGRSTTALTIWHEHECICTELVYTSVDILISLQIDNRQKHCMTVRVTA